MSAIWAARGSGGPGPNFGGVNLEDLFGQAPRGGSGGNVGNVRFETGGNPAEFGDLFETYSAGAAAKKISAKGHRPAQKRL